MRSFDKYLRPANLVMAVLFLFCMALQINDPDPLLWAALYGLAVLSCCLSHFGRLPRFVPLGTGLGCLVWAGLISTRVFGQAPISELVASFEMVSLAVEEAREMIGLVLVGLWMTVLTLCFGRKDSPLSD